MQWLLKGRYIKTTTTAYFNRKNSTNKSNTVNDIIEEADEIHEEPTAKKLTKRRNISYTSKKLKLKKQTVIVNKSYSKKKKMLQF